MKGGTRAAVALCAGYMLGRKRKLRTATIMAIATATGGVSLGRIGLRKGADMLGSTDALGKFGPQVNEITGVLRGDLADAAKAAATSVVNNRLDALTDSLHDRAETLRNPGAAVAEAGDTVRGGGSRVKDRVKDRATSRDRDEEKDTEEYWDEGEEVADEPGVEPEAEAEEPEAEEPSVRRERPRGRSPVTRTGQQGRGGRSGRSGRPTRVTRTER